MRIVGIALGLLTCASAFAVSFDCAKARTPQERTICASPELSDLDDEMASAYEALLKIAPPEYAAAVREDQRDWLAERSSNCGPKLNEPEMLTCLKVEYKSRIPELHVDTKQEGGVLFVWRAIMRTAPDTPGEPSHVEIELNPDNGTLTASWPQASKATPEWQAWNRAMEDAARAATQRGLMDGPGRPATDWAALAGTDSETSVTIDSVNDTLVATSISMLWDGHGAHPNHGSEEFNWLLKQRRPLQPKDVFLTSNGWDTWMQIRIDKYLHQTLDSESEGDYKKFESPGEISKALRGMVTNTSRWRLDGRGLTIEFQPYEVACYACTPMPLTFTWGELKPYLNPAFRIPL
jgi:uncharacterized protein